MENTKIYDVVVIGGGVSGCSCAWNCAKNGLKTLLIEKKSFLGGAISGGLVVPMMKTDDRNINTDFFKELIKYTQLYDAQITYADLNKGWFNPELIKLALDQMLVSSGVEILFNSDIFDVSTTVNASILEKLRNILTCDIKNIPQTYNDKHIKSMLIKRNILSYYDDKTYNDNKNNSEKKNFENLFKKIKAKYFVDASGDAIISELINAQMQPDNNKKQAETLRFIMSNVDSRKFSSWLLQTDKDRNTTNVTSTVDMEFYMTTAYTNDTDKHWGLEDVFQTAIANGDLEESDAEYFQVFGIAKMPNSVAFNCPRLNSALPYEARIIEGRKAIYRIANFCKFYFPGFEHACISQISDEIGVRVSNRPLAVYNYKIDDIVSGKTFENVALHSNYPVDIHPESSYEQILDDTVPFDSIDVPDNEEESPQNENNDELLENNYEENTENREINNNSEEISTENPEESININEEENPQNENNEEHVNENEESNSDNNEKPNDNDGSNQCDDVNENSENNTDNEEINNDESDSDDNEDADDNLIINSEELTIDNVDAIFDKETMTFDKNRGYDFPLESLMSADYNNLFSIGRAIGADFESQAALRIQKSCFSMGEAVGKYLKSVIENSK